MSVLSTFRGPFHSSVPNPPELTGFSRRRSLQTGGNRSSLAGMVPIEPRAQEDMMILVRNVFQLQFGQAKKAVELLKEGVKFAEKEADGPARILTDLTGPFYTLVLAISHQNLAAYEAAMKRMSESKEWGAWYRNFSPLVVSGHREIFSVVQ